MRLIKLWNNLSRDHFWIKFTNKNADGSFFFFAQLFSRSRSFFFRFLTDNLWKSLNETSENANTIVGFHTRNFFVVARNSHEKYFVFWSELTHMLVLFQFGNQETGICSNLSIIANRNLSLCFLKSNWKLHLFHKCMFHNFILRCAMEKTPQTQPTKYCVQNNEKWSKVVINNLLP